MGNDKNWFIRWELHRWFDNLWRNHKEREELYKKLAAELGIDTEQCHFAKMSEEQLNESLIIVKRWWREKYDK